MSFHLVVEAVRDDVLWGLHEIEEQHFGALQDRVAQSELTLRRLQAASTAIHAYRLLTEANEQLHAARQDKIVVDEQDVSDAVLRVADIRADLLEAGNELRRLA